LTRDTGGSVEIPVPYHPLPVYLCHTQCKHRKKRSRTSLQTKIFKKSKTAKKKKQKHKKKNKKTPPPPGGRPPPPRKSTWRNSEVG